MSRLFVLAGLLSLAQAQTALSWTTCGTSLSCASLSVPLEYAPLSTSTATASIALVRYSATVPASQRLGSLLVNPGGPGASGVGFVQANAESLSVLTGGVYDIVGWDPRGVGATTPGLSCFADAGTEYDFAASFPSAPNLWLGALQNSSYDAEVLSAVTAFDAEAKKLADACVALNQDALWSSSTAYVARDMAAIVDALDGEGAKLNYWAFSYGTIHAVEFMQLFPARVGRVVADGVFDAEANAGTYVQQIPNDQVSVRDSLDTFVSLCESAAGNCAFYTSPTGLNGSVKQRTDAIFEDLFENPIDFSGFILSLDTFNVFLWSLLRLPPSWSYLSAILSGLESRDATQLLTFLSSIADSEPADRTAAATGVLNTWPLQCLDNAASSGITLEQIVSLTKSISVEQDTPLLNADLTPLSFCRHFSDKRAAVSNLGVSKIAAADAVLAAQGTKILIVNPEFDPVTPLQSAKHLRTLLPKSSVLAVRGGSGHTSVSTASLGTAQTIKAFFVSGTLPGDGKYFASDQDLFPVGGGGSFVSGAASYNGTGYTEEEKALLDAVYGVFMGFLVL